VAVGRTRIVVALAGVQVSRPVLGRTPAKLRVLGAVTAAAGLEIAVEAAHRVELEEDLGEVEGLTGQAPVFVAVVEGQPQKREVGRDLGQSAQGTPPTPRADVERPPGWALISTIKKEESGRGAEWTAVASRC
jgi:hypothetical protein